MTTAQTKKRRYRRISPELQYINAVRAMEGGDDSAKTRVALFKLTGRGGVERDAVEAVSLLEERAKGKDSEAKWMLGLCYEYGIGTHQDISLAEELYRQSSAAKNAVGKFLLRNGKYQRGGGSLIITEGLLRFFKAFLCVVKRVMFLTI